MERIVSPRLDQPFLDIEAPIATPSATPIAMPAPRFPIAVPMAKPSAVPIARPAPVFLALPRSFSVDAGSLFILISLGENLRERSSQTAAINRN
nr:putative integron gene cassette protein [uncultured bacterium]